MRQHSYRGCPRALRFGLAQYTNIEMEVGDMFLAIARRGLNTSARHVGVAALAASLLMGLSPFVTVMAQHQLNFLEVDGIPVDGAGPYYFIDQGDNRTAFADLFLLTTAMGLEHSFDENELLMHVTDGRRYVQLRVTTDAALGLLADTKNMLVNGKPFSRAVPRVIVAGRNSYVSVTAIVDAFEGTAEWLPGTHTICISTSHRAAATMPPPSC